MIKSFEKANIFFLIVLVNNGPPGRVHATMLYTRK